MGFLRKLFGKRDGPPERGKGLANLAFILLSEPRLPDAKDIADAFRDFAEPGESLQPDADAARDQVVSLEFNTGGASFIALTPIAISGGEADDAAQFSLSSFQDAWKPSPHCAFLIVTMQAMPEVSPLVELSRFTSLLAAVTKSSPAVGVYWGNAGATHDPEFFLSVAAEKEIAARMMLWSGLSMARESDGRLSLLSLGMKQLDLPDLLLVAGNSSATSAVATLFDLLMYAAERGEAPAEGDTVGKTADEKLPVRYVRSPLDRTKRVWRVELP